MRFNLSFVFIIIGVFIVLYFSWISSPRLSLNSFIPRWVANWADKHENDNLRTAVPLFFLGAFIGLFIMANNMSKTRWIISSVLLSILVLVAEIGQLFLPLRSFDFKDIFWGIVGGGIGLWLTYLVKLMLKK